MLGSKHLCVFTQWCVRCSKRHKRKLRLLISFDCIVICFDDDEVGRQASKKGCRTSITKSTYYVCPIKIMRSQNDESSDLLESGGLKHHN